jgi:hypothetical protein
MRREGLIVPYALTPYPPHPFTFSVLRRRRRVGCRTDPPQAGEPGVRLNPVPVAPWPSGGNDVARAVHEAERRRCRADSNRLPGDKQVRSRHRGLRAIALA